MTWLLTFNWYGTWLPGDERGWVERARWIHRGGSRDPNSGLECCSREVMKQRPYALDLVRADVVLEAVQQVCLFRDWGLIAAHVRTTHVHLVVDRPRDPDRAIADFKSYSSRALTKAGFDSADRKRWARGGSTRPLGTNQAAWAAVKYVVEEQGDPMAVYLGSPR
jgi:REP element-mobilizing transposase RayT